MAATPVYVQIHFDESTDKLKSNLKDGKPDGLWTEWYENGQKWTEGNWESEENWKDGKMDGLWLKWHKNGQKAGEANFNDGKIVSQKDWDEEGELIE